MQGEATDAAQAPASTTASEACLRLRTFLDRGAPWDACDAFREDLSRFSANPEFIYWGALAHARAGNAGHAHGLLDQAAVAAAASREPRWLADIHSLRGRLWKDGLHRTANGAEIARLTRLARDEYVAAHGFQHDAYPGINAATLSFLLGEREVARELAQGLLARLGAQDVPLTAWDHATAGEAQLLLGRFERAHESYAAAGLAAGRDAGSIATMRRQVLLLARALPQAAAVLDLLPASSVLAFAGHMIDAPGRAVPRFPAALEPAVSAAIRAYFANLHNPILYTSAAWGADLIAIEAALDCGAEVNILLPFNREEFVQSSVAIGGGNWVKRFDQALAKATRVIPATEESHLGDEVLFEHCAMLVEGLTLLRASQLETVPTLLCAIDAAKGGQVGGTLMSLERWRRCVGEPDIIDLGALRERLTATASGTGRTTVASPALALGSPPTASALPASAAPTAASAAAPKDGERPRRTLKTILFADFAGYSRLHDAYAPLFQGRFWTIVADAIKAARVKPLMANTWGDALYVVFESPIDGAEFALSLLADMQGVDWTAAGLSESSQIRIALHAGPVFTGFDPIIGRDNCFGSSVTRTARIEPVTPPGMIYASEAFAATVAATGVDGYVLEYIGQLPLAKGYGDSRIYRLERRVV